ncbi:hypothetical protein [Evansella tamaricis]|uniref:NADH dehydrogenase subunit 6 n=1 Tax=Evansella tamaricis TaxID=2069301 RepID=A0ABS6JE42_9BACI|nr:hypothetical protein [Evansella tamaricis]MBU9710720.1 hypothetical protein [Evansella tamaricis]
MMKLIMKSVIFSIVVHMVYFTVIIVQGLILTKSYVPEIVESYENVTYLQQEVTFGYVINASFFVFTFLAVAIIGAIIFHLLKKRVQVTR